MGNGPLLLSLLTRLQAAVSSDGAGGSKNSLIHKSEILVLAVSWTFSSMWSLKFSRLASFLTMVRVLQEDEIRSCKVSEGLASEVSQYHFCCIFMVKAIPKVNSDSRARERDSAPAWWEDECHTEKGFAQSKDIGVIIVHPIVIL